MTPETAPKRADLHRPRRRRVRARRRPRRRAAREHLRAKAGGEEPVLPRRRADRRHRGPGGLGQELPLQYDGYQRTGRRSAAHALRRQRGDARARPTQADPRSVVAQSRLEEDPRLKTMWAGYAFAVGLPRGARPRLHARGPDLHRAAAGGEAARHLLHCHASVYVPYQEARRRRPDQGLRGDEPDAVLAEARKLVKHPVACIDCHDPQTMAAARHAARRSSRASARSRRPRRASRTTT